MDFFKRWARFFVIYFSVVIATVARGEANYSDHCWSEAGQRYHVSPLILYAIAEQESSLNPYAINRNFNKTKDVGLMQINSVWFPKLAKYGLKEAHLYDACTSIHVGAWVLAQSIAQFGNTWEAVGAYNAGGEQTKTRKRLREVYARKVYARYLRIAERMQQSTESNIAP